MKPYFSDDNFTLYHGDYDDVLPQLEPVDMVLTDPPYLFKDEDGIGWHWIKDGANRVSHTQIYEKFGADGTLDQEIDLTHFANKDIYSSEKINCVVFCSQYSLPKLLSYLDNEGIRFTVCVWHKSNAPPFANNRYLGDLEYIVYFKKGKSMGGTHETKSRVYKSQINKKDKSIYRHPTIKPVPLIEKFIINHTEEGNTVLDPFIGSGTTAVACRKLGRKCIGIELKEEYCKMAVERYKTVSMQKPLLDV